MEAKDLRIGNYIVQEGYDEDSGGNLFHDPEGDEVITVDLNVLKFIIDPKGTIGEYRPIPINKEWLYELCFNNSEMKVYFRNGEFRLENYKETWTTFFKNNYVAELKYVHQLQNLYFALTGEDLTTLNQ